MGRLDKRPTPTLGSARESLRPEFWFGNAESKKCFQTFQEQRVCGGACPSRAPFGLASGLFEQSGNYAILRSFHEAAREERLHRKKEKEREREREIQVTGRIGFGFRVP